MDASEIANGRADTVKNRGRSYLLVLPIAVPLGIGAPCSKPRKFVTIFRKSSVASV